MAELSVRNVSAMSSRMSPVARRILTYLKENPTKGQLWTQRDLSATLALSDSAVNEAGTRCADCAPYTMKTVSSLSGCRTGCRLWGTPEDIAAAVKKGW